MGVLRYNLFWDQTPFLNLIYLAERYRSVGLGRQALASWEEKMIELGHQSVMTSTQADEMAQHFIEN